MCFSGEMSAAFAVLGLGASYWVYSRTNNGELASGIFFFFTMELLQAVQYYYVAPQLMDPAYGVMYGSCSTSPVNNPACETFINKFLTVIGFLHICLQPYFCHVINSSLTKSCKYKDRYRIIKRLCLIGGLLLFSRYFLSFLPSLTTMKISDQHPSTEWLRGNNLCTFKTKAMWHLGWSVPMADPSYYVMGASIHSFLMFAPFFALWEKKGMVLQGVFLFLFGPVLASLLSDNLMEQASIWCFFSIAQISIMLFLIRETLIINWGRGHISVLKGAIEGEEQPEEEFCRDFINCEYCGRRGEGVEYEDDDWEEGEEGDSGEEEQEEGQGWESGIEEETNSDVDNENAPEEEEGQSIQETNGLSVDTRSTRGMSFAEKISETVDFAQFSFQETTEEDNERITNSPIKRVKHEHVAIKTMKVKSPAKKKKNFEYFSLPPVLAVGLSEKYKSDGYREQPLRLLIVGHNPSDQSYTKGHFYANPSNRMWHLLTKSTIVPTHFTALDDGACPQQCGIGFTDLICGVSETKSNRFTDSEVREHKTSFFQRIEAHMARAAEECGLSAALCSPKVIAFSGVRQWKMLFPPNAPEFEARVSSSSSSSSRSTLQGFFSTTTSSQSPLSQTAPRATPSYGVQTIRPPGWPRALSDSVVFVLPSSSGAAAMTNEERETPYLALGALLSEFEWPVSWPKRQREDEKEDRGGGTESGVIKEEEVSE